MGVSVRSIHIEHINGQKDRNQILFTPDEGAEAIIFIWHYNSVQNLTKD